MNFESARRRPRWRRRAFAAAMLASLVALSACAPRSRTPVETEAFLRARLDGLAITDGIELWAPRPAARFEAYVEVARAESARVRELLRAAIEPSVRVYLVPTATQSEHREAPWVPVAHGVYEAGAFDEGFLFLFVPETVNEGELSMRAAFARGTLRHEFAHAYAARLGLVREPWFNEGLALEIEHATIRDVEFEPHLFPPRFVTALRTLQEGALTELLAWRRAERLEGERGERLYAHAQSFFRFLLERDRAGSFRERVERIHSLRAEDLAELEGAWLGWWRALDPLAVVKNALSSSDGAARRQAASLLPVLAEARVSGVRTPAADDLALAALEARETFEPAARFLVYFRAREIAPLEVERLSAHALPAMRILGATLRSRRGEAFDPGLVRRDWRGLEAEERAALRSTAGALRGLELD